MSQVSNQPSTKKLPKHINYNGKSVLLKYHMMLTGSGKHPANSLAALQEVIAGEVAVIEFDVNYLADNEFGFIHDGTLQRETTGLGLVRKLDATAFKALTYKHSSEPLCTLKDATTLLKNINFPVKLQVDFKEKTPIDDAQATVFLKAIEPLRENGNITIVVGCLADWNLRTLRRLDAELNIGVDFAFHLDVPTADELLRLPTRVGAYGYLDDHMLAARKLQSTESYLRDRTEVLLNLVPNAYEFYLHKDFVAQAIQDGFNPVEFTHTYLPDS
ncbi:MAG: glycerophosphodiester phosphodiesterase family protein, partial [Deinococcota bacterium]